ncbi:MAG: OmpH family outer membrane protein [Bacteroidia bacterium]
MKKIFAAALVCLAFSIISVPAQAQRFVYIDTEYILDNVPDYRSAQKQLDAMGAQWRKEIESMMEEIDKMYKDYQAEQVLLPEEARKKREDAIVQKEKEMNDFKRNKFGPEGELFQKREELIKPIQDKIFDAVQELAKEESLDFILDKSGTTTMLYTNAKYDRSDEILDIMGIQIDVEE